MLLIFRINTLTAMVTLLTLLTFSHHVVGQTLSNLNASTPPSSQDLSLGDMANINSNADLYTGRLNYPIKLIDLPMAGLNIPVGLNYSTTGFRVQEISGANGLGWSNALNGVITRTIRGFPDEKDFGPVSGPRPDRDGPATSGSDYTLFAQIAKGKMDREPDLYSFSFLGFSGTFVINTNGQIVLQSAMYGIKILESPFQRSNKITGSRWVIQDQYGNKYIFGEEATETAVSVKNKEEGTDTDTYTSSWFLKSIVTSKNKQINYTYTTFFSAQYTNYVNMKRTVSGNNSCTDHGNKTWNENSSITINNPKYLTSVSYDQTNITIDYEHNRLDLGNAKAMSLLTVSQYGKPFVSFIFNYGYFTSDDGTSTKRLKLQNITEKHLGGLNKVLFSFYYNEGVNLPARNSFKTDYWGYYNDNTASNNLIGEAVKTAHFEKTRANVLEKVISAFGGTTYFKYELNNYSQAAQNIAIGGLRIARVYVKNTDASTLTFNQTDYVYTLPNSTISSGQRFSQFANDYSSVVIYRCSGSNTKTEVYKSSESMTALYDENGSSVGYSYVTVKSKDNTAHRYRFTNYSDYPDEFEQGLLDLSNNGIANYATPQPLLPVTSMAFARGKILSEELLRNNGQLVQKSEYSYALTTRQILANGTKAIFAAFQDLNETTAKYAFGRYKCFTQDLRLAQKTIIQYNDNNEGQRVVETYTYTDYAPNLIRTTYKSDRGEKIDKYTYRYPFDIIPYLPTGTPNADLPLTFMTANNIVAQPVEIIHCVVRDEVSKVVDVQLKKYHSFNGSYVQPYAEASLEVETPFPESQYIPYTVGYDDGHEEETTDANIKVKTYFDSFNVYDQATQLHSATIQANYQSSLFGYNGLYKVAEISNAELKDIAYTSFEHSDKGNWNYIGNAILDFNAVTGRYSYDLAKGALSKPGLLSNKSYTITYWTKNTSPLVVTGSQGSAVQLSFVNGWRNYKHTVTGVGSITISGTGQIDEVRLLPVGASMATYTYEPFIGVTSKTDQQNRTIYTSYDEYNRLQFIKDYKKNIIEAHCYNLQGEQVNCFAFNNTPRSGTFYKNDCGIGVPGTAVIFSVEAGKYTAGTQAGADAMAQRDIELYGQDFANANGTCSNQKIHARIEIPYYVTNDSYTNAENFGRTTTGDVYIKFYSDAACTTPYILLQNVTATVSESYDFSYAYGGSNQGINNLTFTVPQGSSSYLIGSNMMLENSQTYTDPYTGHGTVADHEYYGFTLVNNSTYYIALPTP